MNQKILSSLTGLRFLAAFSVMIAHSLSFMIPLPADHAPSIIYNYLGNISAEGMQLFFVLSGFIIHYNYSDKIRELNRDEIFKFFIARFARIYPLYFLCLSYDLLFKWSYSQLPHSLAAIPFYLTLTNSWFYLTINDHSLAYQFGVMPSLAWSISTEVFFYIAYPFIGFYLNRINSLTIMVGLIILASFSALSIMLFVFDSQETINLLAIKLFGELADWKKYPQDSFIRWFIYFSPYMRIFEFIIGCITASIFIKLNRPNNFSSIKICHKILLCFAFIWIVCLHVLFFTPGSDIQNTILPNFHMAYSFALPLAIIVFYSAVGSGVFSGFLQKKSLVKLGEASYSIYLFHLPIVLAFRWETVQVQSFQILVGDILRYGLYICSALGASLIIWKIYEMPARYWIREKCFLLLAKKNK